MFVECESEEELRSFAGSLDEDGKVLMGIDNYGFSRLFTWVQDRFGVSWQLNLT
jgi:predicted 3-demethylubiquinone-9 3-methyltransferase (glyoxalase superfamily)